VKIVIWISSWCRDDALLDDLARREKIRLVAHPFTLLLPDGSDGPPLVRLTFAAIDCFGAAPGSPAVVLSLLAVAGTAIRGHQERGFLVVISACCRFVSGKR